MPPDISRYKPPLDHHLTNFLIRKQKELSLVNHWGKDSLERLLSFAAAGKSVRGCLLLFLYQALGGKNITQILPVAVALELTHAAFLIHDDIMDKDTLRRGQTSIWRQFQEVAQNAKHKDPLHSGYSMAINIGDLAIFLAYELLLTAGINDSIKTKLVKLVSQEFATVATAQMQDVMAIEPSKEEILNLYRYKTARYTFSLPLAMGAVLARQNRASIGRLVELGERLGLIYQMKDDELNLIGDPQITGKPLGSDFREKRQTYLFFLMRKHIKGVNKKRLNFIMEKKDLAPSDITTLQSFYKASGAQKILRKGIADLEREVSESIRNLPVSMTDREIVLELLRFCSLRLK